MLAWLACLLVEWTPASAHAQAPPRIRIQSGSRLDLHAQRDAETEAVEFTGQLVDDLNAPIAGQTVSLTIRPKGGQRPARLRLSTDENGAFATLLAGKARQYEVEAAFAGSAHHLPTRQQLVVQLDLAPVRLRWTAAPRIIDTQDSNHRFAATLTCSAGDAGLLVSLSDAQGHVIGVSRTNPDGEVAFQVETDVLSGPRGSLTLAFAGDDKRGEASISHRYVRRIQPELSLALSRPAGRSSVRVRARLTGDEEPLADQPIGLFAGERHVRTSTSDSDGVVQLDLRRDELVLDGKSVEALQARFVSNSDAFSHARSAEEAIPSQGSQPSVWWLTLPLALWAWALWQQRRSNRATQTRDSSAGGRRDRPAALELGRPQTFARELLGISGRVYDSDTDECVGGAQVALSPSDSLARACEAITPVDGSFRLHAAAPGKYRLVVGKAGFEPITLDLQLPHRGQWNDVRIRIQDLRNLMWSESAALVSMGAVSHDVAPTLREAVAPLLVARPNDRALDALASSIERILYAPDKPARDNVHRAAKAVAKTVEDMQSDAPK